jgi:hypothetical protein
MRPEARALGQELLTQHRVATGQFPPRNHIVPSQYTIRYGVLCDRAGVPHVIRIVGTFLGEIAEWCESEGFPPLNSLAVGENGIPGDGYDGAGGFRAIDWPADVEACIRFTGYPRKMP